MSEMSESDRAELVKALTNAAGALDYSLSRFEGNFPLDRKVIVTIDAIRALIRKHSVPRSRIDAIAGLGTSGMKGMDR